jgi:hypothetical protein
MKQLCAGVSIAAMLVVAGCSNGQALEVSTGSDVTVQKKDGVKVAGRLVEVRPDEVIVETRNGEKLPVPRAEIASMQAEIKPDAPAATESKSPESKSAASKPAETKAAAPELAPTPEYREVTIPAGTVLPVELQSAVSSDTSHPEDQVRGTLRRSITIDGIEALPAGTAALGHVTVAERSGRVKGRARVAFRFTRLDPPGEAERVAVQTGVISQVAAATKKQDAAKIGGGAAGGAIIGGILGGGGGAAKGAAIGGAAGTGVVLGTRGKEVRLAPGTNVSVKLTAPVTVRVLMRK